MTKKPRRGSVRRYRAIEEMPPPWREVCDPANLRAVAELMTLHRRSSHEPRAKPGVTRFRSIAELKGTKETVLDLDEPLDDFED